MNAPLSPCAFAPAQALQQVSAQWDADIVPQLRDYIGIPAKSPMFDADWAAHGLLDTVVRKTASFGVTHYHGDEDPQSMLDRADRALYRAKANGRDRIEVL